MVEYAMPEDDASVGSAGTVCLEVSVMKE